MSALRMFLQLMLLFTYEAPNRKEAFPLVRFACRTPTLSSAGRVRVNLISRYSGTYERRART